MLHLISWLAFRHTKHWSNVAKKEQNGDKSGIVLVCTITVCVLIIGNVSITLNKLTIHNQESNLGPTF